MPPSPAERERRREELDRAYRATSYCAGKLTLRVGETSRVLDTLLRNRGVAEWAYLTACDPGSVPLPRAQNEARQRVLLERLRGRTVLVGEASADDGSHPPEPSFLVLGIPRAEAMTLARAFGQNAILAGAIGKPAELVWTEPAIGESDSQAPGPVQPGETPG